LPFTSHKLQEILNVQKSFWDEIKPIDAAQCIGEASLLFSKIEDEQIEQQIAKLGN
jgi:methionyl-tRNA synthetase